MTTTPLPDDLDTAGLVRIQRFAPVERLVHASTAALVGILVVTAMFLYIDGLSTVIGRRELVKDVHVIAGLALPVPLALAYAARRRGRPLRRNAARLARWSPEDLRWLRSMGRDPFVEHGKFHPGQKLNATFTLGVIVVMLATGSIMKWFGPFPLPWRTGATFVHDWLALAFVVVVAGHIRMARRDPEARRGMRRGHVDAVWALRHHRRWAEQELADDSQP